MYQREWDRLSPPLVDLKEMAGLFFHLSETHNNREELWLS